MHPLSLGFYADTSTPMLACSLVPGLAVTRAGGSILMEKQQIRGLEDAKAGARVRQSSGGLGWDRFGAGKRQREFGRVDRFRESWVKSASDVEVHCAGHGGSSIGKWPHSEPGSCFPQ